MVFAHPGRLAVGCLSIALISGCAAQTGSPPAGPPALKEVWFTHTQTAGGQLYPTGSEPQQIWEKTDVFFLGKDSKVIMLIVFHDQKSHSVRGLRKDTQGGQYPFQFNASPTMGRDRSWSVRSWQWDIYGLRLGKHTVDLTVDDVPAGTYSFEVQPDNTSGKAATTVEEISLDTQDRKYGDYFIALRQKIIANWIYPSEAAQAGVEGTLALQIEIAKDGTLLEVRLSSSSGSDGLDQAAIKAVRSSAPFPPVPDTVAKGALRINGTFNYKMKAR